MIRIGVVDNPFMPASWTEHVVPDALAFLRDHFVTWPEQARVYDMAGFGDWTRAAALVDPDVLAARDVTPRDEAGIARLAACPGPLLVTVPPADPITAIIAVAAVAVGALAAFLFLPGAPNLNNRQAASPNNSLSDRTNKARPNGRIPDIFGTVRSVPDLLAVPYTIFEENVEVEIAFMCIGRGSYEVSDVRDGDTRVFEIAGAGVAVYAPYTSPNSGDAPQRQIGTPITQPVLNVARSNEVNGQVLRAPNSASIRSDGEIRFVYPDTIQIKPGSDINFDQFEAGDTVTIGSAAFTGTAGTFTTSQEARFTYAGTVDFSTYDPRTDFAAGDTITVSNAGYAGDDGAGGVVYVDLSGTYTAQAVSPNSITFDSPAATNGDWTTLDQFPDDRTAYRSSTFAKATASSGFDLSGTYTLQSVSGTEAVLSNPAAVNAAWNDLEDLPEGATAYLDANISKTGANWIGPFTVEDGTNARLLANFTALNGLYRDNGKKQEPFPVTVRLEVTPVNSAGTATGPAETFDITVPGNATGRDTQSISLWADPTFTGRCRVRAIRVTPTDLNFKGQVVDEVKWRDLYGVSDIAATDFGNVTTVHSRTYATRSALAVKERRLNALVTRKLPLRVSGSTFTTTLHITAEVDDIIAAMCLDPTIGGRSPEEVDFDSIYDTVQQIRDYFGASEATQFGYTFDNSDMSFEESLQLVAQACFCTAYRQGRTIRLAFERATEDSVLLFNHRNVMPDTQERTVRFGVVNDQDGVELDWTDPFENKAQTVVVPHEGPLQARTVDLPGLRTYRIAYWHAWRAWNRMQYQNVAVDFEATQEAALVIRNDRILVSDMTRPQRLDGEVVDQAGTLVYLSDPVSLPDDVAHTIFLQHADATVEALGVTAWVPGLGQYPDAHRVVLSAAPRMPLATDAALAMGGAKYTIVAEDDVQTRAFIVSERKPQSNFTESVQAVNYSFLYYQNDQLALWLRFASTVLEDDTAFRRTVSIAGAGTVAQDATRKKLVYVSAAADNGIAVAGLTTPLSYTKSAWVSAASGSGGGIIGSATDEAFALIGGNVVAGHGGTNITAPRPSDAGWHHYAAAYDADAQTMTLFVDGVGVATGTIARGARGAVQPVVGFVGRADDLRVWSRALTPTEVRAVYLSTRT